MRRSRQPESVVRDWLSKDTWLIAEQALAAGLVDEVVEPPPLMRLSHSASQFTFAQGPTEDERFVQAMLAGMGPIQVSDKAAFGRWLAGWFNRDVTQI